MTDEGRFTISERLEADCDDGVHYYATQGREIAASQRGYASPARDALCWHREQRYLS